MNTHSLGSAQQTARIEKYAAPNSEVLVLVGKMGGRRRLEVSSSSVLEYFYTSPRSIIHDTLLNYLSSPSHVSIYSPRHRQAPSTPTEAAGLTQLHIHSTFNSYTKLMAAPQIPNLLDSLRNSKGAKLARGGVGGSRGGASTSSSNTSSAHPPAPTSSADSRRSTSSADSVVQQTDDDASGSRLSAVEVGYLEDDFAKAFASPQQQQCAPRRQPVINRGVSTHLRTKRLPVYHEKRNGSLTNRRTC